MDILLDILSSAKKRLVDMFDGTHAEQVISHPPFDLLTDGGSGPSRRVRVDVAQTGFFAGREFMTFHVFSIGAGNSVYLKFVSPVDFILFEQVLTVDAGSVQFSAISGGTEGGTFTALPIIGKNRMAERPQPYYESQAAVSAGGTHSGGTVVEVFRVVAANATAQQATVGGQQATERGLPAGTYYLRLENIGSGTATGVYSIFWEERVPV